MTDEGHSHPSTSERATLLMRGVAASLTGDSSVIAELYTDDVKARALGAEVSSAAELAIELEDRDAPFSDVELVFGPLEVGGDQACVEWQMTGTHSGALVLTDGVCIDATGVRLTMHGVTVAEFTGERIRSFRQYWDDAELLAQLGVIPRT